MADSEILKVGIAAPDFALPNIAGQMVRLSDFRDKQNVVIFFMREFR